MRRTGFESREVPILVIGGGLVGLAGALFLAHHGAEALTIERRPEATVGAQPVQLHLRTMEILRTVGCDDAVRRLSDERFSAQRVTGAVETLVGGQTSGYGSELDDGVTELSPARRAFVTGDALEGLLRTRAIELGADIEYGTELVTLRVRPDRVHAVVRDVESGTEGTIRARYVIAADGVRSTVRQDLGIRMNGYGLLSRGLTIFFHGDSPLLQSASDQGSIDVLNQRLRGFLRVEKSGKAGILVVNTLGDPTQSGALNVTEGLTADRAGELVQAAIGDPQLAVGIDELSPWAASADVAERLGEGRVFLTGDCAHSLPVTGGFGGNTGIQEAHNLAWKLALVVRGTADDELLETFDAERRPVAETTMEQAYTRYMRRVTPELISEPLPEPIDDLSVELGYTYRSGAVVGRHKDEGELIEHPRMAGGRPGTRAPHVMLRVGGEPCSSLDLFGRNFVLLLGSQGLNWQEPAQRTARAVGLPVDVRVLQGDAVGSAPWTAYGISPGGASLVRPDGFVAWRSPGALADPASALSAALRALVD